jgi:hypothetical protein
MSEKERLREKTMKNTTKIANEIQRGHPVHTIRIMQMREKTITVKSPVPGHALLLFMIFF